METTTEEKTTKAKSVSKIPVPTHITGLLKTWMEALPDTGGAEIRVVNHKKTNGLVVRSYVNSETRESIKFTDQHGNNRVFRVIKNIKLDFSKMDDKIMYCVVKNHPIYVSGSNPVLRIVNVEEEAHEFVSKREIGIKAAGIVSALAGNDLRMFARVVFIAAKTAGVRIGPSTSDNVIKKYLYDIVDTNPSLVVDEYEDDRKLLRQLIRAGLETSPQIFKETKGVISFQGEKIGTSFEQAVEWLGKNQDLLASIQAQVV